MRDEDENAELAANFGWILLAIGLMFVVGGVDAIRRGKVTQSVQHRWGYFQDYDVECEHNPIQFLIYVLLYFTIGGALVVCGVYQLLTR